MRCKKISYIDRGGPRQRRKKWSLRRKLLTWCTLAVVVLFVLPMTVSIALYEGVFGKRGESEPTWRTEEEFPDLAREKITFASDRGQQLTGYLYNKQGAGKTKALLVVSNGIGGTHLQYLDEIAFFARNGFTVLGWDATGNGESGGDSLYGLPQEAIDLTYCLQYVQNTPALRAKPLLLYGHSLGAYASVAVLNNRQFPVKAVVSRSGFNRGQDMLLEFGERMCGPAVRLLSPYIALYERVKFGNAVDNTGVRALQNTSAKVLIQHSDDDPTISLAHSLYASRGEYAGNDNVKTELLHGLGHNVVPSAAARAYRAKISPQLNALPASAQKKELLAKSGKDLFYELDAARMQAYLDFFNDSLAG